MRRRARDSAPDDGAYQERDARANPDEASSRAAKDYACGARAQEEHYQAAPTEDMRPGHELFGPLLLSGDFRRQVIVRPQKG